MSNHPASKEIIRLYNEYSDYWSELRKKNSFFEKGWLDRFLAFLPHEGTVLDMGCGNGDPISGYLIQNSISVHGVDASIGLLAQCEEKYPKQTWQLCDMRVFESSIHYEGIIAWDSFFHLTQEDQISMIRLFGKYLKLEAPLMFTSGHENGEAIGYFKDEELFHASLSPNEYKLYLFEAGFDVIDYVLNDSTCGNRCVWLAKKIR